MSIDVELLLSSIQERAPLWEQSNKQYGGFSANAGRFRSAWHCIALPGPDQLGSALVCNKPQTETCQKVFCFTYIGSTITRRRNFFFIYVFLKSQDIPALVLFSLILCKGDQMWFSSFLMTALQYNDHNYLWSSIIKAIQYSVK